MEETLQRQETAYNQTVGQPTIVMSNSATPFYPAHKFLAPLQIDPYGDMLYQVKICISDLNIGRFQC